MLFITVLLGQYIIDIYGQEESLDVGKHTPAKKVVQFFVTPDVQLEMVRIANYPTKLLQVVSPCHAL